MVTILPSDSFRGFSAAIDQPGQAIGDTVKFIGRVCWPGDANPTDAYVKVYRPSTCGVANEAIGYAVNTLRSVPQPRRGAVLVLSYAQASTIVDDATFIDSEEGTALCWATALELDAKPLRYMRTLPSFSEKQLLAFIKSSFTHRLSEVDHVTGNNDRNNGNILYLDDLNYLAIDQGNIGGGLNWHTLWPDAAATNELIRLAHRTLARSDLAAWQSAVILEHQRTALKWPEYIGKIQPALQGLLDEAQAATICEYMLGRASGNGLANSCGALL
jgi:hypothetical protein